MPTFEMYSKYKVQIQHVKTKLFIGNMLPKLYTFVNYVLWNKTC